MDSQLDVAAIALPETFEVVRELARRRGSRVVEARFEGRPVALRIETGAGLAETRAELAVLASVDHPGIARLVDHGVLPGGDGRYLAREWVAGDELTSLAETRTPEELGRIVAKLCPALEHLHERGFVHADLKPANVMVREGDEPVLLDFGLSRARDHAGGADGVSGSYFGIAPEVLLGNAPDERADLFALGVLLHGLLAPFRVDAATFYGRFPGVPFLEAIEADPEELPEWARDVVARLVARDPDDRPASAALVGRMLEGRLGVTGRAKQATVRPRLRWPVAKGREAFLADATRDPGEPWSPRWWALADAEEADSFASECALRLALEGRAVEGVRLDRELRAVGSSRALDRWACDMLGNGARKILCVSGVRADRWSARALEYLARALDQGRARRDHATRTDLIVCAPGNIPLPGGAWQRVDVPSVEERPIVEFLAQAFGVDADERLETLASRLHAESSGSTSRLQMLLEDIVASGWVQVSGETLHLRAGPLPDWLGRTRGRYRGSPLKDLGDASRRLLAFLALLPGREAGLDTLAALTGGSDDERTDATRELIAAERVAVEVDEIGRMSLKVIGALPISALELSADTWRALHEDVALHLRAEGRPRRFVLPHLYAAGSAEDVVGALVDEARVQRDRGCPELALDVLMQVANHARTEGRTLETPLRGELALTWAVLGDTDRALETAKPLKRDATPEAHALMARVRGQVATVRQNHEEAVEHFERALALGIDDGGAALLAKARLLFETQQDAPLDALATRMDAGDFGEVTRILDVNVHGFASMSAFRRGEIERARAELTASLERALAAGDAMHEAVVRINLGTVDRRTGRLNEALAHFERARSVYEEAGFLPGLAQTQSLYGGTLRESGALARAAAPLAVALETFERLGDASGAAAARGLFGLLQAERGHLRAALEELEVGARDMLRAGRSNVAALLESRALEARVRIGEHFPPVAAELEKEGEQDPRVLIALARAAWLGEKTDLAADYARRAQAVARKLRRAGPAEEAAFLLARLEGGGGEGPPNWTQPAVAEDARIFFLLGTEDADLSEDEVLDLADALARKGRDDRAARLYLALAARAGDEGLRKDALRHADERLALCTMGLTHEESKHFEKTLLGLPEPWPRDLERASADADEDWEMDVLSVLNINQKLVEQEDLPTLLGTIVDSALEVTGAERGFLVLEENGELSLDLAMDSRRGDIDVPEVEISQTIVQRALADGAPLRISNATDDPVVGAAPSVSALELRSILCHPFEVQSGLRGVIYLDNRLREGAFTDRSERLVSLLAGQAALAIRQVRRFEEIARLNSELNREVVVKESDLKAARRALVDAGVSAPVGGLVGGSPAMRKVHDLLNRVAPSKLSVLVSGASGTGKELAARALHDLSPWKGGPFVSENCAALPASLIESELFGYKKGAFTGADRDREGLFQRAHGGTLFLDEIGELPLELQAKLLRVLETQVVRRIGDSDGKPVDFRLVAATNRDLAEEVEEGRLRSDLYYRLDGVRVEMPPLSKRIEDIPELVDHFLRLEAVKGGVKRSCSPELLRRLCERTWPGNVRELANEIARLCVLSSGDIIDVDLLREAQPQREERSSGPILSMAELERKAIMETLDRTGGDKNRTAELLGVSRAKIYQRLKEWRAQEGEGVS